jgi:phage/plasmid primase-like uncharacterized protein
LRGKRRFQCVNADAPQRASGNNGQASAQKSAEAVNTTSNPTFATKSANNGHWPSKEQTVSPLALSAGEFGKPRRRFG